MAKGFLKDVAGIKRLRIVKSGFDANNLSLPQNAVVFDSESLSSAGIYASGSTPITADISNVAVATWPNLGFTPFAEAWISKNGRYQSIVEVTPPSPDLTFEAHPNALRVYASGLNYPVVLHYIVYRIPA